MKAIAKQDCSVTLTTSLNSLSLLRREVKKGEVIELEVYQEQDLTGIIAEKLGNKCVVFNDGFYLIPTYSKNFDYVK